MKKYIEILCRCPLFDGINQEDLKNMLDCLKVNVKFYKKGQTIFSEGTPAESFGIVLSGSVQIVRNDFYGNRSIIANIVSPHIFGESFACAGAEALPLNVIASEDAEVMLISSLRITKSCSNACGFHNRLIFNLLKIVAKKNLIFHQRIEITSKRTTKEKLLAYLNIQAKSCGSNSFTIPFDRQGLADYLDVDRSGLSAEIGKLCRQGLIECHRSKFTVKQI